MLTVISMSERSELRTKGGCRGCHADEPCGGMALWQPMVTAQPRGTWALLLPPRHLPSPSLPPGAAQRGCAAPVPARPPVCARAGGSHHGGTCRAAAAASGRPGAGTAVAGEPLGNCSAPVSERDSDLALSVWRGDAGGSRAGRRSRPRCQRSRGMCCLRRLCSSEERLSGLLGCCAGAARAEAERGGLTWQGGREASGGNSGHVCGGCGVAGRGAAPGPAATWV